MSRKPLALAAAVLLGLFLLDAALVLSGRTTAVDNAALLWLRDPLDASHLRVPGWTLSVAVAITTLGTWYVRLPVAAIGALLLARAGRSREALLFAASVALAALALPLLKDIVARTRPDVAYQLITAAHPSFPSGHALGATVAYPLLGQLSGRRALLCAGIALALAIGLSRVFLGVHWLSDVAGGWLLGAAWVLATLALVPVRR